MKGDLIDLKEKWGFTVTLMGTWRWPIKRGKILSDGPAGCWRTLPLSGSVSIQLSCIGNHPPLYSTFKPLRLLN
ncbi:hypothetical protein DPEC_G00276930 [Dallia pectoralis]|uniref:Uncharacterized protein n=1 Tax=Dallia pectoralis TaxID=75939 RepID=A0ACC2FM28_DALPE|nr:hypothetical protein DPEC_G00276930 [Dallia pectoralis]